VSSSHRATLVSSLRAFPVALGDAVRATEGRRVPPGEWGPTEVVRHLIAVEIEVHQARLRDLETKRGPHWSWAEPGPWPGEPSLTLEGLLGRFADLRAATIATVEALDDAGWARTGTHATYGPLDVASLLDKAVDHDREHVAGLA
jgi:hypothetical protein